MLRAFKDIEGKARYFWWNDFTNSIEEDQWQEWREMDNPRRRYDPAHAVF